jgi:CheY-like chemotaxis protein
MPKLSGLDVMKKAKESPQPLNQNKSVVFLTNLDKGEEIKEALLLGNGYLIKSQVTPGDLVKEVQLYLAPHGQAVN